jgi:hypothetical protein
MRRLAFIAAALVLIASPALADMGVSFTWGDIPRCTSGHPGTVPSPQFVLTGVPAGTATVDFRLKDLNVPSYNHGGATLRMGGAGTVPFGTFTYRSPCPPGGVHTYEWRVTARDAAGNALATATARRTYPE